MICYCYFIEEKSIFKVTSYLWEFWPVQNDFLSQGFIFTLSLLSMSAYLLKPMIQTLRGNLSDQNAKNMLIKFLHHRVGSSDRIILVRRRCGVAQPCMVGENCISSTQPWLLETYGVETLKFHAYFSYVCNWRKNKS